MRGKTRAATTVCQGDDVQITTISGCSQQFRGHSSHILFVNGETWWKTNDVVLFHPENLGQVAGTSLSGKTAWTWE